MVGVGWITNDYLLSLYEARAVNFGWLAFRAMVNASAPLYSAMKTGYDKYWLRGFYAGVNAANASTPSHWAVSAFNSFHAAAHALHVMFLERYPPVYARSKVRYVHG